MASLYETKKEAVNIKQINTTNYEMKWRDKRRFDYYTFANSSLSVRNNGK